MVSGTGKSCLFNTITAASTTSDTTNTILKTNLSFLIISIHFLLPQYRDLIFQGIGVKIRIAAIKAAEVQPAIHQNQGIVQGLALFPRTSRPQQKLLPENVPQGRFRLPDMDPVPAGAKVLVQ